MISASCVSEVFDKKAISPELVHECLRRLAAHSLFIKSARVRRFLEFTIEYALSGRSDELKEYLLGVEVFDRSEAHDPRLDPIVRVEARRVRAKLRDYYRTSGAADPLVIDYPCGSYVPRFRPRHVIVAAQPPALIAVLPFAPQCERWCARFAEGLTREVIAELTRSTAVRLLSGGSMGSAEGAVEALLAGSVLRTGSQVRVTARLLSTGSARNLWSEQFESMTADPLVAQKQIAFAAAHAVSSYFHARG